MTAFLHKPAAIIFDCDGVLVDSESIGLHESVALLNGHGLPIDAAQLVQRYTGMRQDVFAATLMGDIVAAKGRALTEEEATAVMFGLMENRRLNREKMTAVTGAIAAMTLLKPLCDRHGVGLAVASSSKTEFLENKIAKFGFKPFFGDHYYSADLVDQGKPAPDIFLYAADRLGVDCEKCIVIEDSGNGVISGLRANMQVFGLLAGSHCFEGHEEMLLREGAHRVYADYDAMMKALIKLIKQEEI